MKKYQFKMYYGAKPGEEFETFFEAFFEARSDKEAGAFGDQLAKLYTNHRMPIKMDAVYSYNVYPV
jgi:hypothetical protein